MKRMLVVGYGNPYRADDGAGYWAAVEYQSHSQDSDVQVIAVETLTPAIVEQMADAECVVFLEGSGNGRPGSIVQQGVFPDETVAGVYASNCLTPAVAVQACKLIYQRSPKVVLFSVKGANLGFGYGVSPVVKATFLELMQRLDAILIPARAA